MEWISVEDRLPEPEKDCLISNGVHVGVGYYEAEYFAEDPEDPLQYSSDCWHQEGSNLKTCNSGFADVTHWMPLPNPPAVWVDSEVEHDI